jgi:hypothetical protein
LDINLEQNFSLIPNCRNEMSKFAYNYLARADIKIGEQKDVMKRLDTHNSFNSVALKGEHRTGKTILISQYLNSLFPWWYHFCFPPRGLFLVGNQRESTISGWLNSEIFIEPQEDPWSSLFDFLDHHRRQEQRTRLFLQRIFKDWLPSWLKPQPFFIIVDDAENLLISYRAAFLVPLFNLVKKGRDRDLFRLVILIVSDNSAKALNLIHGKEMFDIIEAPKVSKEAVQQEFGDEFQKVFEDCDDSLGIAIDYINDSDRNRDETAKDYALRIKEIYRKDCCLIPEISTAEYQREVIRAKHI